MQNQTLKFVVLLLLGFGLTGLHAQTSINASGGNASGSGGSASYSVGQLVYQTHTGTNASLAEGVQQPFEISVVTTVDETQGIELSVSAFPNPVADCLTLEVRDIELSNFRFQLCDMNGKLLHSDDITREQTAIVMSNLLAATYFVKVSKDFKEVKTFKIVKR